MSGLRFFAPSPVQLEALRLYGHDFNVFPQPFGKKAGYDWKRLQYTRLHHDPDLPRANGLLHVFMGRCNLAVMTGRTSGNLFILDCETRAALDFHIGQMRTRKLPLWVVQSPSRKGGGHIYVRCSDGEVANVASGVLHEAEVRGNRCYVLAPPSVHPEGGQYHWTHIEGDAPPIVRLTDIDWLTDKDGNPLVLALANKRRADHLSRSYSPLSRKTQEYLASGSTITEGARNTSLFNAACDYHGCEFSIERARRDLAPVASASGLPDTEIAHAIESAYSKPRTPSRVPGNRRFFDWQLAAAFAQTHSWTGRKGATERAVFNALVERARLGSNDNGVFRATQREIAELARVTALTARKTVDRFKSGTSPLLHYAGSNTHGASLYRFSDDVLRRGYEALAGKSNESNPLLFNQYGLASSGLNSSLSDAAERGKYSLGANGMHVYQVLLTFNSPASTKAIAERAKLTLPQVRYSLAKLLTYGLVERAGRTYVAHAATSQQLDDLVARPAGTLGKGERRRQQHAKERALHAGELLLRSRYQRDRANLMLEQGNGRVIPSVLVERQRCDLKIDEAPDVARWSNEFVYSAPYGA